MKRRILEVQERVMPGYTGQAFAWGNSKLPQSTLIVNLTSAKHCPSKARGLCKVADVCYAIDCEELYKYYLPKNLFVEKWLYQTPSNIIIELMTAYLRYAPEQITCIRLNEAGDFIHQNQIVQWNRIAQYFYQTFGIVTYTYTARIDLDYTVAPYIIVNGSLPGIAGAIRQYYCVPPAFFDNYTPGPNEFKCPADCTRCNVCSTRNFKGIVYCRQH